MALESLENSWEFFSITLWPPSLSVTVVIRLSDADMDEQMFRMKTGHSSDAMHNYTPR